MSVAEEYASTLTSAVEEIVSDISAGNPLTLSVVVSVVVVLFTLLFFFVSRRSSHRRSSVLLMGPCESGKSLLYLRLVHSQFAMTYTSLKENTGHFVARAKDKILTIVDIPGHDRLRSSFLEAYAPLALGVVFLVDSSTISKKTVADVAEFLYAILTDPAVVRNGPRVLIACNKQDLDFAKRQTAVKSMLETELNTLRKTRSSALASTSDEAPSAAAFLGRPDRDFEFAHLGPGRVTFVECSCQGNEEGNPDLGPVIQWLDDVA